ncbi:MAG TPA: OB-fold nucleic acid binding domain-containing protein, partial [Pseudobdellovibrionaceae bacterium]|nr:OB-fold nucleic acid binding domain-containing protein [Pseudobdellovibrionaceae bacterium]
MALRRDTSIQYLKGVGPKLGDLLQRKGLKTVQDLIEFYPRSYEDRRAARQISSLKAGDLVSLKAQVAGVHSVRLGRSTKKMYDVILQDATGRIHCKFFRVPYKGYFERFSPHQEVRVVGKVIDYRGRLEFHHPDLRDVEPDEDLSDALVPIYTEIEGFSTVKMQKLVQSALHQLPKNEWASETLPPWMIEKFKLMSREKALRKLHDPPVERAGEYLEQKSEAHRRIIF